MLNDVIYTASKKGFFNIPIFKDYIRELLRRHFLAAILNGEHVLLIIDSAPAHKIIELNEVYKEFGLT